MYLRHILDAIQRIGEYTEGIEYNNFLNNNLIQAGVIRELEIVGEATKRLSKEIKKKYPDVPGTDGRNEG
ncbi:MAG TPA: HepT-like ribonuclease domain-containing protein [Methanobacterium sp.]